MVASMSLSFLRYKGFIARSTKAQDEMRKSRRDEVDE